MKSIIVFVLALATVSAFNIRVAEIDERRVVVPPLVENEGRIANGNVASVGQFPYQVGLVLEVTEVSHAWCGGSLIGNQWVLTAAHCIADMLSATVYLGATDRKAPQITLSARRNDFITHSGYNSTKKENDIALIRIPFVSYNPRINAVRLPAIANTYPTYVNEYAIASGWGATSDSATSVSINLHWGRMQVSANSVCSNIYPSLITSSHICVVTGGTASTCKGDSGGPLVLESSSVLIGVTAFGASGGCERGYPVVFTRVTDYLDWIKSNTGISY